MLNTHQLGSQSTTNNVTYANAPTFALYLVGMRRSSVRGLRWLRLSEQKPLAVTGTPCTCVGEMLTAVYNCRRMPAVNTGFVLPGVTVRDCVTQVSQI